MGYEGVVRKLKATEDGQPLVVVSPDVSSGEVIALSPKSLKRIAAFQAGSLAANTVIGYANDWKQFEEFCDVFGYNPLPAHPLAVADYLTTLTGLVFDEQEEDWVSDDTYDGRQYRAATLDRWLAAINKKHEDAGFFKPGSSAEVQKAMSGVRRALKIRRPTKRAAPLLIDELRAVVAATDINSFPRGVTGTRDVAMLLMGFAGAFRRSEIAGLKLGHVTIHPQDGLHVRLVDSKTDKNHEGLVTALPYGADPRTCPVCAYCRWIRVSTMMRSAARGPLMALLREQSLERHICHEPLPEHPSLIPDRPVFQPLSSNGRTSKQTAVTSTVVMNAVTAGLERIGVDPTPYSAHSLRAGFVTQALRNGATIYEVMKQTHHTRVETVAIYDRESNPLMNNAVTKVGL